MNVKEFLEQSAKVDATMQVIDVADTAWAAGENGLTLSSRAGGQSRVIGSLSPRAVHNLSKLSKASPALLAAQADATLNALLRTQLTPHARLRVLMDPSASTPTVISLWPEKVAYVSYSDMLSGVESMIKVVRGDAVSQDAVVLFVDTRDSVVNVNNKAEAWAVGPLITVSSNCMTKHKFQFGGWRTVGMNMVVDDQFSCHSLKGVDHAVITSIVSDFSHRMEEYSNHLHNITAFASGLAIDSVAHLEALTGVPKPIVEKLQATIEVPSVSVKEISDAGVGEDGNRRIANLFDAYCVLTHFAKGVAQVGARTKIEEAAFRWMFRCRKMFGK